MAIRRSRGREIEENQKETIRFTIFNTYYGSQAFGSNNSIASCVHGARVNAIKLKIK